MTVPENSNFSGAVYYINNNTRVLYMYPFSAIIMSKARLVKVSLTSILLAASLSATSIAENGGSGEWRAVCSNTDCRVVYPIYAKEILVSRIIVSNIGGQLVLEYLTPLEISIEKGIRLQIDNNLSFNTKLLTCNSSGCLGGTAISNSLLLAMLNGNEMRMQITAFKGDQSIYYPYSLIGFTKAMQEAGLV